MSDRLEAMTGYVFVDPWWLTALFAIPLVFLLRHRLGSAAVIFSPAALFDEAFVSASTGRRRKFRAALPALFTVLGLLAAVVALARPAKRVPLPRRADGIDIMLVLDTSSSMRETDLVAKKNRLLVAKDAARSFVERRPDDRIGLVGFARYPDLRCPPTLDRVALTRMIDDLVMVERDGPEDATGIGTAVAKAAESLRRRESRARVLVLLTDGEENVGTADAPEEIAPLHAAQLCQDLGIRVYAIAAGKGKTDSDGRRVPIDTGPLRRMAKRTAGRFFEVDDGVTMNEVYAAIDRLETVEFAAPRFELVDRFFGLLAVAITLIVAGRLFALAPILGEAAP